MGFVNSFHGIWKSTLRKYDPTRWQIKEDVKNMNYRDFDVNAMRKDAAANDMTHYFSHHFSAKVAFLFYKIGVSPNFVTWFFLLVGCASAISIWLGNPVLAFLLWRVHIIIDMADGTLARATKTFSRSADGFDRSNHIIINTAVLIATTHLVDNDFVLLVILISFYLTYFFSRNYYLGKRQTYSFNLAKNIAKDLVGLEGYLFFTCVLQYIDASGGQVFLSCLYSCFFITLYFIKLNIFFQNK